MVLLLVLVPRGRLVLLQLDAFEWQERGAAFLRMGPAWYPNRSQRCGFSHADGISATGSGHSVYVAWGSLRP